MVRRHRKVVARVAVLVAALVARAGVRAGALAGALAVAGAEGARADAAAVPELRGHGGTVQALAVEGDAVLSGGFDTRAILWDGARGVAEAVLQVHEGAVTAVSFLGPDAFATGGQDGRIAFWTRGRTEPRAVVAAHDGPVSGLAPAPDGTALASSGWDGRARIWPLADGAPGEAVVIAGHEGNVNGVAWLPDGGLATAGYDATVRVWARDGAARAAIRAPAALNGVAADAGGLIWTAGVDGYLRALQDERPPLAEIGIAEAPLVALAADPARRLLAIGAVDGTLAVVDTAARRLVFAAEVSAGPVWAVAFAGDAVLAGGADHVVRAWDAATGAPLTGSAEVARVEDFGDGPGAQVFRMCAACHTLDPDDGGRAGPTLHGIFGRRIGTAEGYAYSQALREMDIVWTPETVARLFEIGPAAMTPGTKMPEQRIPDPADRAALIAFLEAHAQ